MGKQTVWEEIDKKSTEILEASDQIWGCAETAFTEHQSMKVLCELLRKEGFQVEEGLAGVETAFKGTFGSGKPVIGFLGEFDALSGLDQEAGATEKKQLHAGAPGHGCGVTQGWYPNSGSTAPCRRSGPWLRPQHAGCGFSVCGLRA